MRGGRPTPAITRGHNKDHRPDLKQLLYILTLSDDGGVPVHFRVASGNYVADSKLATAENMAYLHHRGGRFITVLPQTRAEDKAFRLSRRKRPEKPVGRSSWGLWDWGFGIGGLALRGATYTQGRGEGGVEAVEVGGLASRAMAAPQG